MLKRKVEDLAYFGGDRLFDSIRITGQLSMSNQDVFFDRLREIYRNRVWTNSGPLAKELELRLKEFHGTAECVVLANACFGLIMLLKQFAGARRGEVLLPAFSYRGLPHVVRWAGQRPRYCDVLRQTHTLNIEQVAKSVGANTVAILAVHNVNALCEISELEILSGEAGVPLIFDSVYALGSTYRGKPTGAFGDAEVFSMHATKLLNGFEGGYITTNDRNLARALREMRNFGIQPDGSIAMLGLNAKLNEVHAAMALTNLSEIDAIVDQNTKRLETYQTAFRNIDGVSFAKYCENCGNRGLVLLEVEESFPLSRKQLIELLRAENALVRPYYDPPLHKTLYHAGEPEYGKLPVSEDLCERYIQMPAGDFVSKADILELADFMRFLREHAQEIEYGIRDKVTHA